MKHQRKNKKNGSHDPRTSAMRAYLDPRGKEMALAKLQWVGNDFTNGKRGAAKSKAGFKKAIRSAVRRQGKVQIKEGLNP
jgi:hypothetical protein